MTIPVQIDQLAATLTVFDHAYLVTQRGSDEFAKIMTVDPVMQDDRLLIEAARESVRANVAADSRVTLIWPPRQFHGFSLIVDGWGTIAGDAIEIEIHHGMLHRPREHGDGPEWVFPSPSPSAAD